MRHALLASLIVPLSTLVIAVGPVGAADDAELQRIQSAIADAITKPIGGPGGAMVELASPVSAVWRDGKVLVSLKGLKVQTPVEASITVGDVDIEVLPRGEGLYDFDVVMPKSFPIQGDSPNDKATLTISDYKFKGTWSAEVENIVNVDAMLDDLLLTNETADPREKFMVSIDDVAGRSAYTKGSDGLWTGTASGKTGAIVVKAPEGEGDLEIAGMEASATSTNSDWSALAKAMNRFEELMAPGAPKITDVQRQELSALFGAINWGDNQGAFSVRGLAFTQGGQKLFSLGDTTWKLLFNAAEKAGKLGIRVSFDGINIIEQFLPPNLTPTKGAFDVTLENFPVRSFLASMFMQAMETANLESSRAVEPPANEVPPDAPPPAVSTEPLPSTSADPNAPAESEAPTASEMIGEGSGASEPPPAAEPPPVSEPPMASEPPMMGPFRADDPFLQEIFQLASNIVLNELSVSAADAGVSADGRLQVDPEAEAMGTGKVTAKLRGIDNVLEYVNQMSQSDPDMKDFGAFLIFLKGLGRAESAGGETVYVYDIDIQKQGAPTVNGTSLDNMNFD